MMLPLSSCFKSFIVFNIRYKTIVCFFHSFRGLHLKGIPFILIAGLDILFVNQLFVFIILTIQNNFFLEQLLSVANTTTCRLVAISRFDVLGRLFIYLFYYWGIYKVLASCCP